MSDERAHDTASESKTSDGNLAAPDVANDEGSENDPVFTQEQQHLSDTYATLQSMAGALAVKMRKNEDAAAAILFLPELCDSFFLAGKIIADG